MREQSLRRVQITGGSTLIVSLPKKWVRTIGLKPGDYVVMQPQPDGSLRIMPAKNLEEKLFRTEMVIRKDVSVEAAVREFISRYLAGYDIVSISFDPEARDKRAAIKDILRKMIGVEIIEEHSNMIVVQCLANPSELPVRTALRRMANLATFMFSDFLRALESRNFNQLYEMRERDDNVDRFYIFILRQLKMIAIGLIPPGDVGLKDLREGLGYRMVIKNIERIADHITEASECLAEVGSLVNEKTIKLFSEIGWATYDMLTKSINSLFTLDVKEAHEVTERLGEIKDLENQLISEIFVKSRDGKTAALLRLVVENIRRIADYSCDISEITINLAVENPLLSRVKPHGEGE